MKDAPRVLMASDLGCAIRSVSDISDLISVCFGAHGVILTEADLCSEFFDLRTGLAGETLQKLTNYGIRAAIVVADVDAHGERFTELIYEHRSHETIRFFSSVAQAEAWLAAAS